MRRGAAAARRARTRRPAPRSRGVCGAVRARATSLPPLRPLESRAVQRRVRAAAATHATTRGPARPAAPRVSRPAATPPAAQPGRRWALHSQYAERQRAPQWRTGTDMASVSALAWNRRRRGCRRRGRHAEAGHTYPTRSASVRATPSRAWDRADDPTIVEIVRSTHGGGIPCRVSRRRRAG